MNSEELEQSLRTEFESYLKNVLADMRQEVADFQKQFEAEFEKHKTQVDEVFQNFSTRIAVDREIDAGFTESVVEHLRLSRDEGARITAMAIAEAEELEKQKSAENQKSAAPASGFSEIRDAIADISSKTTQSAILKTLVNHAAHFTPRGAFFIIKNEHFVGWRAFGKDGETVDEQTVREVYFPVAASSVIGEAARSLSAVESAYGVYANDSEYLGKLKFGEPEQMYAVPLVVRGRAVAVLYADPGENGGAVDIDALDALVRVASMTVEILASTRGAHVAAEATEETSAGYSVERPAQEETDQPEEAEATTEQAPQAVEAAAEETLETAAADEETAEETYTYEPVSETDYSYQPIEQPVDSFATGDYQTSYEGDSFSFKPSVEAEPVSSNFVSEISPAASSEEEETPVYEAQPAWSQTVETEDYYSKEPSIAYEAPAYETESPAYEIAEPQTYETQTAVAEDEYAPSVGSDYQFEANQSFESPQSGFESNAPQTLEAAAYEAPQYEEPQYEAPAYEAESFAPANGAAYDSSPMTENGGAETYAAEAPVEVAVTETAVKQPAKSRFSERNVDLPIEVSDDERRLHNDARRFARLLVSEIKLYNEQKVKEGRESNDLYDRLREAIDRSREMYDKRVQPPVAAKFDYFHYELINNLAEGEAAKLGDSYPGSIA